MDRQKVINTAKAAAGTLICAGFFVGGYVLACNYAKPSQIRIITNMTRTIPGIKMTPLFKIGTKNFRLGTHIFTFASCEEAKEFVKTFSECIEYCIKNGGK